MQIIAVDVIIADKFKSYDKKIKVREAHASKG
jgi:hypothetical protein